MMDPNDAEQIGERNKRRKARATQEQRDLMAVAQTPEGSRVLHRIMAATGRDRASFVPTDAMATAYREGQRSIGIQLADWLAESARKD